MVKEGVFWFQGVLNADAGFRGLQEVLGGRVGAFLGVAIFSSVRALLAFP